jgi:hypothetical protein
VERQSSSLVPSPLKLGGPPLQPGDQEQRLLVSLCARAITSSSDVVAFQVDEIDWPRLLALAKRHRVAPLVSLAVAGMPASAIPPPVSAQFRAAYAQNALNGLRLSSRLIQIAASFAEAGIAMVPLKGVCLAARYYPVPAARHAGDIDLLIAPERIDYAAAILDRLGYRPTSKAVFGLGMSRFEEELRFEIL